MSSQVSGNFCNLTKKQKQKQKIPTHTTMLVKKNYPRWILTNQLKGHLLCLGYSAKLLQPQSRDTFSCFCVRLSASIGSSTAQKQHLPPAWASSNHRAKTVRRGRKLPGTQDGPFYNLWCLLCHFAVFKIKPSHSWPRFKSCPCYSPCSYAVCPLFIL